MLGRIYTHTVNLVGRDERLQVVEEELRHARRFGVEVRQDRPSGVTDPAYKPEFKMTYQ